MFLFVYKFLKTIKVDTKIPTLLKIEKEKAKLQHLYDLANLEFYGIG